MNGTNYSTGGFRRITRRIIPQVKMRVFGFFVVVILGSVLILWLTHTLWTQFDQLRQDHAAVKSETFYFGVHLRSGLRALNNDLLQFGVSHDPTFRDTFLNESLDLRDWIATNEVLLADTAALQLLQRVEISKQMQILKQIETLYSGYLTNATKLLAETNGTVTAGTFEESYKRVREMSSGLFPLCDDLVAAQRQGFGEFLRDTQETLVSHQHLLMLCSAMILALALILAVTVYRGMIAPLRVGLRESSSIIERQEKLASLGILASGVAHEVRNPLTAIKFRLFSLRKAVPAVADNEDAAIIGSEINRLEDIVQNFLQFARPSEPKLTRTPATSILEQVSKLLYSQLERSGIILIVESPQPVDVHADARQITQVLINLVQNAAESIHRNGTITLRLRRTNAEVDGRQRAAAIFAVEDSGKGIAPEIEARLFDPFFTTKEGGTGLGLAISARIVEKHGGLLRYETRLSEGTIFEVVLPAIEENASEHSPN